MKKLLSLCFIILGIVNLSAETSAQIKLREAIEQENVKLVRQIIKQGVDVNIKYDNGTTPLHIAASKGNLKIVKLLVKNGADVNIEYDGANPLYFAAWLNHTKIMKYLIKKGANVNTRVENSMSILIQVSLNCQQEAIKILMKNKAKMLTENVSLTPIDAVASANPNNCSLAKKEEILKMMIKLGADINMTRPYLPMKLNALDFAITNNQFDIEKMLVKLGAKSNYAIIFHTNKNNKEMIEFLLGHGFNINTQDELGNTALDYAHTDEMKQFLISHGAKSGKDLKQELKQN